MQEVGLSKHGAAEIRAELRDAFDAFAQDKDADKLWRDVKATAMKLPALAQFEAVRQWLEQPVVAGADQAAPQMPSKSRNTRQVKSKSIYRTPKGRPVEAAYSRPRHGPSSLLAGFLRGPWG